MNFCWHLAFVRHELDTSCMQPARKPVKVRGQRHCPPSRTPTSPLLRPQPPPCLICPTANMYKFRNTMRMLMEPVGSGMIISLLLVKLNIVTYLLKHRIHYGDGFKFDSVLKCALFCLCCYIQDLSISDKYTMIFKRWLIVFSLIECTVID